MDKPKEKTRQYNGKEYYYYDIGKGEKTVIFLHGTGEDKNWALNHVNLELINARKILLDLPGHGKAPLNSKSTLEDLAEYVRDFLKGINLHSFYIVGFSLGGLVGLKLAELFHNEFNIEGMCSWSTPISGFEQGVSKRGRFFFNAVTKIPIFIFDIIKRPAFLKLWAKIAGVRLRPYHISVFSKMSIKSYRNTVRLVKNSEVKLGYSKKDLVIYDVEDLWIAVSCFTKMAELNHDRVKCVEIDGCGHYGTREGWKKASQTIDDFINL